MRTPTWWCTATSSPATSSSTLQGQVQLLDFGIAKLMAGDATEQTQLTREWAGP